MFITTVSNKHLYEKVSTLYKHYGIHTVLLKDLTLSHVQPAHAVCKLIMQCAVVCVNLSISVVILCLKVAD